MQEKKIVVITFITPYFTGSPCSSYEAKRRKAPHPSSFDYHHFKHIYNFFLWLASNLGVVAQYLLPPDAECLQIVPWHPETTLCSAESHLWEEFFPPLSMWNFPCQACSHPSYPCAFGKHPTLLFPWKAVKFLFLSSLLQADQVKAPSVSFHSPCVSQWSSTHPLLLLMSFLNKEDKSWVQNPLNTLANAR